jgi:hypothetical protein
MTQKIYRSAQGKPVDIGSLILQNEQVRAVGNMNVNARGDVLDSNNKVIDQKNRQIQRQVKRVSSNVLDINVHSSTLDAKRSKNQETQESVPDEIAVEEYIASETVVDETPEVTGVESIVTEAAPVDEEVAKPRGGLAAAIAKSRNIKQELEKTTRQKAQEQGLKKI